MSNPCACEARHQRRRVVLTGGPGAGKTAVLDLVDLMFCDHVVVLPESARIVYSGGFPRDEHDAVRRAGQRAIYHVQRELEAIGDVGHPAVVLCDRGTVDGAAYWPGPGDLFEELGSTLASEHERYDAVIHLRPSREARRDLLRPETHAQSKAIDQRIASLWNGHPRMFTIDAEPLFLAKAMRALAILREEVPACCRPPRLVLD